MIVKVLGDQLFRPCLSSIWNELVSIILAQIECDVRQTQFRERLFSTTCSMVSKVAVLLTSEVIVTTLTPIVPSLLVNRLE